jgi:hypothetical protein
MRSIEKEIDKMKYDSFLNSVEDAFGRHCSKSDGDQAMLAFAKELIEKFVSLYGGEEESDLRLDTRKIVLEYFMHQN